MAQNKVRLGIIGYGNMGVGHVKYILDGQSPDIELAAIADLRGERRDAARAAVPGTVKILESGDELIDSGLCDAVLIAVPHYDHPTFAVKAFDKGLHVMIEKPAGVYTKQVREMNEAAAIHPGLVFGIMYNVRTNSVYKKMRELVTGGSLGAIKRVNWIITSWYRTQSYYDSGTWRATWDGEGGGVLLNQCPHNLDLLWWICGMPNAVRAFCHNGKWHDIEVEDDVTAYLEYPNGATGVFVTTTADAPGTNRFEVTLEWGKLVCEDDKLTLYKLDINEREFCATAEGGFDKPPMQVIDVETDGEYPQHCGVLNAFAEKILRGGELIADGGEGINGLIISNAMHLSSWLDKTVAIPFDEELFLSELRARRAKSAKKAAVTETTFDTENSHL
jgi:predicted dehydrogenase